MLPLVILTGAVGLLGKHEGLLFIALLAGGLTWSCKLWSQWAMRDLVLDCELSASQALYGDPLTLTIGIENRKRLAVPWCQIRVTVPAGLTVNGSGPVRRTFHGGAELEHMTDLGPYQRVTIIHQLTAAQRGCYRLGPFRVAASDLFGFFECVGEVDTPSLTVSVFPSTPAVPASQWRQLKAGDDTRRRMPLGEDPSRFLGIRPYAHGDRPSRVDWKRSAQHSELLVKVFEPRTVRAELLILDCDTSVSGVWDYSAEALEASITIAASVLRASYANGASVGLAVNAIPRQADLAAALDQGGIVPIGRGPAHLARLFATLARIEAPACKPMERVLRNTGGLLQSHPSIIYIASRNRPQMLALLEGYAARGYPVALIFLGPAPLPKACYRVLHWHRVAQAHAAASRTANNAA